MTNAVQKAVAWLLALFPCALAGALGLTALCVGWEWAWPGHGTAFYLNPPVGPSFGAVVACVLAVSALAGAAGAVGRISRRLPRRAFAVGIGIVLALALLRWTPFLLFSADVSPYSDFCWAWQRAVGLPVDAPGLNHRWWPAWINYSLFLKGASAVGRGYWTCLLLGMVFDLLAAMGIYGLLKALSASIAARFLGVMLYLANPSSAVYGLVPTPEHMAVACFTWAIGLFVMSMRDRPDSRTLPLLLAGAGLAGIGESVKPLLPVVGCALFLGLVASPVKSGGKAALRVLLFVVVAKLTALAVTQASAGVFGVELSESTAYPYYLNVGLNRQGEGQIHVGRLSRLYVADLNRGVPLEQARANVVTRLREDWRGHVAEIPSFVARKMVWAWQGDLAPFTLLALSAKPDGKWPAKKLQAYRLICDWLPSAAQVWYVAVMFALAGLLASSALGKPRFGYGEAVLALTCLGFFALVLVGEAQSRYKCLILPYLCVLLADRAFVFAEKCGFAAGSKGEG